MAGEMLPIKTSDRSALGAGALTLSLILFAGALIGVILSPAILEMAYPSDQDYTKISDVGQAYGGASAVVAGMALFVVTISVFVQYRQLRVIQLQAQAPFNKELVKLAMAEPRYRQCWGGRISPDGLDEDLFYYCSDVIKLYTQAWELRNIDEYQARTHLQNFFDSEVPRRYWQAHGDWHRRGNARSRRERFRDLINDEFLRSVKAGPPSRGHEFFAPDERSASETRSVGF